MFGQVNAKITKLWAKTLENVDIHGTIDDDDFEELDHDCWLEETTSYERQVGFDSQNRLATLICNTLDEIKEGDVLEVTPTIFSGESLTTYRWKVLSLKNFYSFPRPNLTRIRRMELDLIQERS